jgi:NAD(P)H dehydrogenase (quinone)
MIAITAATGQLGQLVVEQLLSKIPARELVAVVRNPAKAETLASRGVVVRPASYTDSAALERAFTGVDKLLLISGNEFGQRATQHRTVIDAAKRAGVKLIVYTSLLRADTTALSLGPEHAQTEAALKASGLSYILLRNGWYHDNYTGSIKSALSHGAYVGSSGSGRISSASRADYAAAAVVALTGGAKVNHTYELAGDESYTLTDLAAEVSRQAGKNLPYHDLPEGAYAHVLRKAGVPEPYASGLASWGVGASQGALFDDGRQLSALIGRPTTPMRDAVRDALRS